MSRKLKTLSVVVLLATCGCVCYDSAVNDMRSRYDDATKALSVEASEVVHE